MINLGPWHGVMFVAGIVLTLAVSNLHTQFLGSEILHEGAEISRTGVAHGLYGSLFDTLAFNEGASVVLAGYGV